MKSKKKKKKKMSFIPDSDKIITSYEDGFKLAKKYKLMNTFRRTLLILRNEIQQPNKKRGTATVQEMFNYLVQTTIIRNTEKEFIQWLKSWKGYVMTPNKYTKDVQRRLKCAYTGNEPGS